MGNVDEQATQRSKTTNDLQTRDMKKCEASLVSKEIQMKTIFCLLN